MGIIALYICFNQCKYTFYVRCIAMNNVYINIKANHANVLFRIEMCLGTRYQLPANSGGLPLVCTDIVKDI